MPSQPDHGRPDNYPIGHVIVVTISHNSKYQTRAVVESNTACRVNLIPIDVNDEPCGDGFQVGKNQVTLQNQQDRDRREDAIHRAAEVIWAGDPVPSPERRRSERLRNSRPRGSPPRARSGSTHTSLPSTEEVAVSGITALLRGLRISSLESTRGRAVLEQIEESLREDENE